MSPEPKTIPGTLQKYFLNEWMISTGVDTSLGWIPGLDLLGGNVSTFLVAVDSVKLFSEVAIGMDTPQVLSEGTPLPALGMLEMTTPAFPRQTSTSAQCMAPAASCAPTQTGSFSRVAV